MPTTPTDPTRESEEERASLDQLGPVDYLVVEFPAGQSNFTGEMAKELLALVDAGTIRVIDVLILKKNELFPDNWIYIHTPGVQVGRIQNFNNWSSAMVPVAGMTCMTPIAPTRLLAS